ncbi:hypothetical protein SRHO_G00093280 [Serrasalmus rhombeus]
MLCNEPRAVDPKSASNTKHWDLGQVLVSEEPARSSGHSSKAIYVLQEQWTLEPLGRTKCVGITAKTAGSTKAQPTPGWREVKDSSSSNELKGSAFQKAPAITDSSSSCTRGAAFSPRRPPGSASQPASLEGATARCRGGARERGPGPDGPF